MKEIRSEDKLLADFTENLTGQANTTVEMRSEDKELLSLFKAVQTIYSVERFQERMSLEKIQRIIGMAVTIEDFRRNLFEDIVAACRGIGLSLTPKEVAALRNLKEDAVKEFANSLDERITKFFPINLP